MGTQQNERPKGVATGRSTFSYMVTIKCNHTEYTSLADVKAEYYKLVQKIKGAEWHTQMAVELDSLQRLHVHGLFTRDRKLNPASYRKPGWTIHFQEVNYEKAKNYIYKEPQNVYEHEQRDIISLAHYHYLFIN